MVRWKKRGVRLRLSRVACPWSRVLVLAAFSRRMPRAGSGYASSAAWSHNTWWPLRAASTCVYRTPYDQRGPGDARGLSPRPPRLLRSRPFLQEGLSGRDGEILNPCLAPTLSVWRPGVGRTRRGAWTELGTRTTQTTGSCLIASLLRRTPHRQKACAPRGRSGGLVRSMERTADSPRPPGPAASPPLVGTRRAPGRGGAATVPATSVWMLAEPPPSATMKAAAAGRCGRDGPGRPRGRATTTSKPPPPPRLGPRRQTALRGPLRDFVPARRGARRRGRRGDGRQPGLRRQLLRARRRRPTACARTSTSATPSARALIKYRGRGRAMAWACVGVRPGVARARGSV